MASLLSPITRLRKSSSLWALLDQSATSLGSFATTFGLMRAYKDDHAEFGIFGLIYSSIQLLNNLHASVITYPLSVKGAKASNETLRLLTSSSLLLTLLLALPLLGAILIACLVLDHLWLFPSVAMAMLAGQIQETVRRGLMAHLRHNEALWGDMISYLGQASIVLALCYHRVPGLNEVFLAMAATSLIAAVVQALQVGLSKCTWADAMLLAREGWMLGRWLLMSNGLNLVTIQLVGWVIFKWHGEEAVAVFYALSQLMGVTHPVMFSISNLMVPGVARENHAHGRSAAQRYALKMGALGMTLLMPYFLFLLIVPGLALRIVAGAGSPYIQYTTELRWFVLQYIVLYMTVISTGLLNGMELPRASFFGQLANGITSVVFRLPIAAMTGLTAALWSGIITYGAHLIVNLLSLRTVAKRPPQAPAVPVLAMEA